MSVSTPAALAVVAAAALIVAGCGSVDGDTQIRVSAASSLSDVFVDLEMAYEASHAGTDVVLNLGGSPLLREQILAGAPVDVFASASVEIMEEIEIAGLTEGSAAVFAVNPIEIAVPRGNPADITGLGDFSREELYIGLCAEEVPCGRLAGQTFESAGVVPVPDTHEPNVRSLLTKVEVGELDGGIVYATDVIAGDVDGIVIPNDVSSRAVYPVGRIADSPNPSGGTEFVTFMFSDEARRILARHGFEEP